MIAIYGDIEHCSEPKPVDEPELLYWFEKETLLCTYSETTGYFYVLNGAWEFRIDNGMTKLITGEVIHEQVNKPKAMTRKQFDKIQPNFGY